MVAELTPGSLPSVSSIAEDHQDPFRTLVSTVISLRTKDEVTTAATERLFDRVTGPADLAALPEDRIAELIYPAGFYRTKAARLRRIARILVEEHSGSVPADSSALLALPGVGRKTANLVLGLAYGIPAICVDTHVHRIANRLGWVSTKTPEQTEEALAERLPRREWIRLNGVMVSFGQQVCTPQAPYCSRCPLREECPQVGVRRSR
jgi:endonuclease-3